MNVSDLLLAAGQPDAVALIDHGGVATTYRALRDEVQRTAAHLQALAAISRLMRDERMRNSLEAAPGSEAIYGLLCNVIDRDAA